MGLEDAAEEGSVVGVDCASDTNRWLNPIVCFCQISRLGDDEGGGLHVGQSVMVDKRAQHEAYR